MDTDMQNTTACIRVLIADDHPAVTQGLGLLLGPEGIHVCAEARSRAEAVVCADDCRPDLALVDLCLGDDDGLDLVADFRRRGLASLVYSMHEDGRHVQGAFAAGALGYVTKRELHRVLVEAIREAAAGRRFVSPRAALALADRAADTQAAFTVNQLSGQEREVYRLLGEGEGTSVIAAEMKISTRTVESYCARIMVKLGLETMRDLRRHAIDHFRNYIP